jgi:hypothetical protein
LSRLMRIEVMGRLVAVLLTASGSACAILGCDEISHVAEGSATTSSSGSGLTGSTGGQPLTCTSDLECPGGKVCDTPEMKCVPGCHFNSDCSTGDPCVCSDGLECQCPLSDGGNACEVGTCRTDTCAHDTSLCPDGDDCVATADGGSICERDPRAGVLCQPCALGAGAGSGSPRCAVPGAQAADFCLVEGSGTFCGVDCLNQSCPSGYACNDVTVLTQRFCSSDAQCVQSKIACVPDGGGNDCPSDSQCIDSGGGGFCGGHCLLNEDTSNGYCTCVSDSDCPKDSCTGGYCQMSLQPCLVGPSGDAFCTSFVTCVDVQGTRACLLGRNCTPKQGLACPL